MEAKIDLDISSSLKNSQLQEKWDINHTRIVEARIIVNAFFIKCLALSHRCIINDLN